jgi:hypothetical protein
MNAIVTHGPWCRFKLQLHKTWSELTDEDLQAISRHSDELAHVVQHRYGSLPKAERMPPHNINRARPRPSVRRNLATFLADVNQR